MISLVINADTRIGSESDQSTVGDHGKGSLQGVRSYDFLVAGVQNKLNFFSGHSVEVILYIDEHEPPDDAWTEMQEILRDIQHVVVCQPHERSSRRWNEAIYLSALKLATGDYVAHFDQDCAAFRDPNSDIITHYLGWLNVSGYKFVCQPTTMAPEDHKMYWASTRFFICKRETLDFDAIEQAITNEAVRFAKYGHAPALEHVLGRMAGKDGVLYPPANWDDYVIFSWARYHKNVLKKLNGMPYPEVRDYILGCGILGPNDVVSVPL